MSRLFTAVSAELRYLYLKFLFFAPGKMIVLVLTDRAAHYDGNSVCHMLTPVISNQWPVISG